MYGGDDRSRVTGLVGEMDEHGLGWGVRGKEGGEVLRPSVQPIILTITPYS